MTVEPEKLYEAEMGKPPPAAPDPETDRQFSYEPKRGRTPDEFLIGDPGDEDEEPPPVLDGQESLL